MELLADLEARGLVHDTTDRDALRRRLAEGPIGVYVGFDPTADSLHVGHLFGQLMLRRFQLAGHRPFPLAGGATGMVGDPGGRSEERTLLDLPTLRANTEAIRGQLASFLDFEPGPYQATLVNNADWTEPVGVLDFLRDVGKHITLNQMVAKESVRQRMASANGISYTEFSYMLLQAFDFQWLYEHHGVELQMGGSDQWGNITTGIDLIRKTLGQTAYGMTWPLLLKADGGKFGKTADGSVWLDPAKTSPFQFRQFWFQTDDDRVEQYLKWFSFLGLDEIEALVAEHHADPGRQRAQRVLAQELTTLVHGPGASATVEAAADVLFGGDPTQASDETFATLANEIPTTTVATAPASLIELLVHTGLASSNGDARRTIGAGGVYVNGVRGAEGPIEPERLVRGRFALVRKGKSNYHLVVIGAS
jgi:tyrosyl-tRNA synthetase